MKLYRDPDDYGDDLRALLDAGGDMMPVVPVKVVPVLWCAEHNAPMSGLQTEPFCLEAIILLLEDPDGTVLDCRVEEPQAVYRIKTNPDD